MFSQWVSFLSQNIYLGNEPIIHHSATSFYIDDSWLVGPVWDDCGKNVVDAVKLLDTLGFVVHLEKSVFIPTQKLVFPGFIVDSISMLVYITPERALKLKRTATDPLNCKSPTIREVVKDLGLIVLIAYNSLVLPMGPSCVAI